MGREPATARILPVFGVVPLAASGAGLARVRRVDEYDLYSSQCGFVHDVLPQAIKRPCVQVLFVFTACACRVIDFAELFESYDGDMVGFGKVDDLPARLVVLFPHPALLFVAQLFDGFAKEDSH